MFIGQTGMNISQAQNLELRNFFYLSHLDGYQVKEHKNRRGGIVLFDIFKDYKPHFERYLEWRRNLFPKSSQLFPFVRPQGSRQEIKFDGFRIRGICEELDIPFVGPRLLRNTRVNWLLRMTADPTLTAEMAQHTQKTLLRVYERPSLQRTMVEAIRFWEKFDPHLARTRAVAPGDCAGIPAVLIETPKQAPKPNCLRKSGCLWCENHRDIDSLDYIWALATFKHLKIIELGKVNPPQDNQDIPPAQYAIDRIQAKLNWFAQSSDVRCKWVSEAEARITEGDFHSEFRDEISVLEGVA